MNQATTTQPSQPPGLFDEFRAMFYWPEVQLLGGLLLILLIARLFRKTDKLADARWADKAAIRHARRKALKQIKHPKISNTALYLGDPKQYPIPDAHRHIAVIGTTDAGKTTSAIDQLIRSSLEQGFTAFVYDVKAEQLRKHAAYALSLGYQVHCFAPGMPWSGCYDPLGFLRDEYDSTMARQIAATINRNMMPSSKRDDFFGPAADSLMETVLLLAKGSAYPDFLMAWAILSLPNLARRLAGAQKGSLDLWAQVAATTTVSVAEAEKTVAGIVGGAVNAFRSFISRDLLPSIVGTPTIPLRMDGKHLVFFQVDEERSAVCAPLCALMLRMFMLANLNNQFKRETPLCVFLDEFTSAYFPDLDVDLNLRRAYGLVAVLGYQGRSQLLDRYGRDKARNIETGTVTKLIFKTTDEEHQQALSRALGEKEAKIESRSYGSSSNSRSENIHKVPLFPAHQFGQMDQGEMILVNSGYKSRRQSSLPLHIHKVKINPHTFELERRCLDKFESKIRPRLIHNAQSTGLQLNDEVLRTALIDRMAYADMILPEPEEVQAAQQAQQEADAQDPDQESKPCMIVNSQN